MKKGYRTIVAVVSLFLLVLIDQVTKFAAVKCLKGKEAFSLIIAAGAIGNMIDRLLNGYVIDFLYFSLIDFPIFNVADIYVTVAMVVLFILILTIYKDDDFHFLKLHGSEKA